MFVYEARISERRIILMKCSAKVATVGWPRQETSQVAGGTVRCTYTRSTSYQLHGYLREQGCSGF